MRTFVLLCAALAVLQTVTAMTGPEGHTTDESGGPPAGWPDNKEDCENMEGGFWREDHQRCESEDMCNTMGGFWDANRCELEEEGESDVPDNKEDCENMEGGFWQEDRRRCETELLCNEHGGQWTGFRCEFGEGHHSTTAYPGHHSNTAYPGHHSTTSEPYYTPSVKCAKSGGIWRDDPMMMPQLGWCDYSGTSDATTAAPHHHSTTISYWEQRERECTMHGGKWHWDIHWCDYHSTTAHPGHHSTTAYPNSYWEQRKYECDSSGGSWHWDGRKGWCYHHSTTAHPGHHWTTPYPGHTTTLSPYGEFLKDCEKEGGAVITNHNHTEREKKVCIGVSQYICNIGIHGGSTDSKDYDIFGGCVYHEPEPEPAYPHTTTEQYGNENSYWKQRKHECHSSGGSWHWDGHKGSCYHHSTTAHPGTPGGGNPHTTTSAPYPEDTTEHYGNDCIGDQCCGDGTQFENGVCVPTYEGVMDACREERKEWGWTCETSCPADGANGDI